MLSTLSSRPDLMKLEFSGQIFGKKILKYQNFMRIRLVEAELFHADGRTLRS